MVLRRRPAEDVTDAAFTLRYDGPALAQGRMDARDLASALISLGDLFLEANRTLHPETPDVTLSIEATERGSFDVGLVLHQVDPATVSAFGETVKELVGVVFGGGILPNTLSLFSFLQTRRGRPIVAREPMGQGVIRARFSDGASVDVPEATMRLHDSFRVRRNTKDVIHPLTHSGVDKLEIIREEETLVQLGREDVPAFAPEDPEPNLSTSTSRLHLQVLGPAFDQAKWRVTDGTTPFFVTVEDETFRREIDEGKKFGKGDALDCTLRIDQSLSQGKLVATYAVEKVHQVIYASTAPRLFPPSD